MGEEVDGRDPTKFFHIPFKHFEGIFFDSFNHYRVVRDEGGIVIYSIEEEGEVTKFDSSGFGIGDFETHHITRYEVTISATVSRDRTIENNFVGAASEFNEAVSQNVSADRTFDKASRGVFCLARGGGEEKAGGGLLYDHDVLFCVLCEFSVCISVFVCVCVCVVCCVLGIL